MAVAWIISMHPHSSLSSVNNHIHILFRLMIIRYRLLSAHLVQVNELYLRHDLLTRLQADVFPALHAHNRLHKHRSDLG